MNVTLVQLCPNSIAALATAIATAVSNSAGTQLTNQLLADILATLKNSGDTEVNAVCVSSPTYNGVAWMVNHFEADGSLSGTNFFKPNELGGTPIPGAVIDPTGAACCGVVVTPVLEPNSYDVSPGFSQPTKLSLDMPTFNNAYAVMNTAPWTAADLAATLNANAAGAVPPGTGANYSTTVWAASAVDPNRVYVVSGPAPSSLDLVSIPVSVPVTP